ncbi:MAG TPA: iron-sulfur cluster assembly protein, partial [Arachnia sp.]|nr:iron-sulfur cluster assembly protein [Arachnia sp.]
MSEHPLLPHIRAALHEVEDPEIRRPITDLGMVDDIQVSADGDVAVRVLLTVSGCPMRSEITGRVTRALRAVEGVREISVDLGVMNDEQREAMRSMLRGGQPAKQIPFAQPGNLTRVIAVASGKGGVGKSSVTVNLALALAKQG